MPESIQHILDYWQAGGPLVLPITLVCFAIWFTAWRMRIRLLTGLAQLNRVITDLPDLFARNGTPDAVAAELDQRHEVLAVSAGRLLAAVAAGTPFEAAFAERLEPAAAEARRDMLVLRALIGVAPLLGLLGTVFGMMATFGAVGGRQVTEAVAAGISTALITTQFGLFVAIPGMFGAARVGRLLHHFQSRLTVCRTRLVIELDRCAQTRQGAAA